MLNPLSSYVFANEVCVDLIDGKVEKFDIVDQINLTYKNLEQASSVTEANELVYSMTVLANQIFDQAVGIIFQLSVAPNPFIADEMEATVSRSLNGLQTIFNLTEESISSAVEGRLNVMQESFESAMQEVEEKKVIGFTVNESYMEFHFGEEPKVIVADEDKPSIGFVDLNNQSEQKPKRIPLLEESSVPKELLDQAVDLEVAFKVGGGSSRPT